MRYKSDGNWVIIGALECRVVEPLVAWRSRVTPMVPTFNMIINYFNYPENKTSIALVAQW